MTARLDDYIRYVVSVIKKKHVLLNTKGRVIGS